MSFNGDRGEVYIRETAPGLVILSWYPHKQDDPGWPGSIIEASRDPAFPVDAWETQDASTVATWVELQPFWNGPR